MACVFFLVENDWQLMFFIIVVFPFFFNFEKFRRVKFMELIGDCWHSALPHCSTGEKKSDPLWSNIKSCSFLHCKRSFFVNILSIPEYSFPMHYFDDRHPLGYKENICFDRTTKFTVAGSDCGWLSARAKRSEHELIVHVGLVLRNNSTTDRIIRMLLQAGAGLIMFH